MRVNITFKLSCTAVRVVNLFVQKEYKTCRSYLEMSDEFFQVIYVYIIDKVRKPTSIKAKG